MTTPHEIAAWLGTLPRTTAITPMTLTIKGTSYPAAAYTQQFDTMVGSRAYREGERTYSRTFIHAVGMLPKISVHYHVAFTIGSDPAEWYVASYTGTVSYQKQAIRKLDEFAPFGNCFILAPWDFPEPIDKFERNPYKRVPMTVALEEIPANEGEKES